MRRGCVTSTLWRSRTLPGPQEVLTPSQSLTLPATACSGFCFSALALTLLNYTGYRSQRSASWLTVLSTGVYFCMHSASFSTHRWVPADGAGFLPGQGWVSRLGVLSVRTPCIFISLTKYLKVKFLSYFFKIVHENLPKCFVSFYFHFYY